MIEKLNTHGIVNKKGDTVGVSYPNSEEMMNKINEIIDVVNQQGEWLDKLGEECGGHWRTWSGKSFWDMIKEGK